MSTDPARTEGAPSAPSSADRGTLAAGETLPPADAAFAVDAPTILTEHPRYRIIRLLGVGGMGAVYEAEHRVMQRRVALKVVQASLVESPTAVERFRREVQAAARLVHPNIVTAYDAEQAGKAHFLAMEYVDGVNLAQVVSQRGPLPVAEAADCVRQAALGLQHAHEHGMVHRDIKPHNMMLQPDGQLKILDFGLARFASENPTDATLTQSGTWMGTPDYMAPEQARDPRTADIRADIYSLGCTLYHLLVGHEPFPGGTAISKAMAHIELPPQPLRELRADVSPELDAVVARMMAKDVNDRYQTPAEVAQALAPFAAAAVTLPQISTEGRRLKGAKPARARAAALAENPGSKTEVLRRVPPPSRWLWLVVAALGALVIVLAVVLWSGRKRSEQPAAPQPATDPALVKEPARPVPALQPAAPRSTAAAPRDSREPAKTDPALVKEPATPVPAVQPAVPRTDAPAPRDSREPAKTDPALVKEPVTPVPAVQPSAPRSTAAARRDSREPAKTHTKDIWPEEELRLGKIAAPDATALTVLYQNDFRKPKSDWPARIDQGVETGYGSNGYFMKSLKGPGAFRSLRRVGYPEFACRVDGRSASSTTAGWGIIFAGPLIDGKRHGIQVKLTPKRALQIFGVETTSESTRRGAASHRLTQAAGMELQTFHHRAIKPIDEFNAVLVVVKDRFLEVYVNGVAVCNPVPIAANILPARAGLTTWFGKDGGHAEFARLTIWAVDGLPRLDARVRAGR